MESNEMQEEVVFDVIMPADKSPEDAVKAYAPTLVQKIKDGGLRKFKITIGTDLEVAVDLDAVDAFSTAGISEKFRYLPQALAIADELKKVVRQTK